jgi:hypothetical protein
LFFLWKSKKELATPVTKEGRMNFLSRTLRQSKGLRALPLSKAASGYQLDVVDGSSFWFIQEV